MRTSSSRWLTGAVWLFTLYRQENTLPIFGGPAEGIHITTHDLSLLATHGSSFA